jgi:hypothetical protein
MREVEVKLHTHLYSAQPEGEEYLPHTHWSLCPMKSSPGIHWIGCWVTYLTDFYPVPPDLSLIIIPTKITISLNTCCLLIDFIFRKSWVPFLDWRPATSILPTNIFSVCPTNDGIQP